MNKEFGTTILLSEATREAAGDLDRLGTVRFRGKATVRGRSEPMPVYSLELTVAPPADEPAAPVRAVITH
jgi:class 3 adenylate cyclase